MKRRAMLGVAGLLMAAAACTGAEDDDGSGDIESRSIGYVQRIERRPDGLFDVWCVDGRREVANKEEILADTVCSRPHPTQDAGHTFDSGPGHDGGSTHDAGWPSPDGGPSCSSAFSCAPGDQQWSHLGCTTGYARRQTCNAQCTWVTVHGQPITSGYDGPCEPLPF